LTKPTDLLELPKKGGTIIIDRTSKPSLHYATHYSLRLAAKTADTLPALSHGSEFAGADPEFLMDVEEGKISEASQLED
jgi:hypothetical protein